MGSGEQAEATRRHSRSRAALSVNSDGRFDTFSFSLVHYVFSPFAIFSLLSLTLSQASPVFSLALRKRGCTQTKEVPVDANTAQQNAGFAHTHTHTHTHTLLAQDGILLDWTGIV